MIDNFDHIKTLLRFPRPTSYYVIEISKRAKDNENMVEVSKYITSYYIYSKEELDKLRDEILCACEVVRGRAYIWMNYRDIRNTTYSCLHTISELLQTASYKDAPSLFRKTALANHNSDSPTYLVDGCNEINKSVIKEAIHKNSLISPCKIVEIPTPNGYHLITTPFNIDEFSKLCPEVSVFTDAPTVLYAPIFASPELPIIKTC